jgi:FMN phosphatase YigB (HAD superfamily)
MTHKLFIIDAYNTLIETPQNGLLNTYFKERYGEMYFHLSNKVREYLYAGWTPAFILNHHENFIRDVKHDLLVNHYNSTREFSNYLASKYGIEVDDESIRILDETNNWFNSKMKQFDSTNDIIDYLSLKGQIHILSNCSYLQAQPIRQLIVKDYVGCDMSCHIGKKKPSKTILKDIINSHSSLTENTYMIGDSIGSDILPAVEIGVKCIYISNDNIGTGNLHSNIVLTNDFKALVKTIHSIKEITKWI